MYRQSQTAGRHVGRTRNNEMTTNKQKPDEECSDELVVVLKTQRKTCSATIHITPISNGFLVKAGESPVFFTSSAKAFDAISAAGKKAFNAIGVKND